MRNVLSNTEFYILQYLWSLETPTTFAEIMVHFTEEGKTWKKQTVNTFLSRMIQKGYLKSDKKKVRELYMHVQIPRWNCHSNLLLCLLHIFHEILFW